MCARTRAWEEQWRTSEETGSASDSCLSLSSPCLSSHSRDFISFPMRINKRRLDLIPRVPRDIASHLLFLPSFRSVSALSEEEMGLFFSINRLSWRSKQNAYDYLQRAIEMTPKSANVRTEKLITFLPSSWSEWKLWCKVNARARDINFARLCHPHLDKYYTFCNNAIYYVRYSTVFSRVSTSISSLVAALNMQSSGEKKKKGKVFSLGCITCEWIIDAPR